MDWLEFRPWSDETYRFTRGALDRAERGKKEAQPMSDVVRADELAKMMREYLRRAQVLSRWTDPN